MVDHMADQDPMHSLAEKVGYMAMSLPYLRESVQRMLREPGADHSAVLTDSLAILAGLETSCAEVAALFEQVRRAPE